MRLIFPLIASAFAAVEEEVDGARFGELRKDGAVFVKFYAPWCGHCKKMAPAWTELANEINPDEDWEANIISIDCTQHKSVCSENGVSGYPTVKLFYPDVDEGIRYSGARTKDALADWLDDELTKKYGDDEDGAEAEDAAPKGEVAILDDGTFKATVAPPEQITLVKFFAPWCGHCKKMAQGWIDLAKMYGEDDAVVIAEVDCTQHQSVCTDNGVKGYPTIKAFKGGEEIEKYAGARDVSGFKSAIAKYKGGSEKPKVVEKPKAVEEPVKTPEPTPAPADAGPNAPELTADNFASTIATGSWMVKFYAPWCGHCKSMAGAWEDLAKARKAIQPKVGIASVDCTVHNPVCKEYDVKGFPTVLFFQDGRNLGKHQGGRDMASLQKSIGKFLNPEGGEEEEVAKSVAKSVDQFNARIKGKQGFVKFFAPWCGHCKKIAPTWTELEDKYAANPSAAIFDVDCTADEGKEICTKAGVRGYPTLQHFDGTQAAGEGTKYSGGRDIAALSAFMDSKLPAAEDHDEL